MADFFLAPSLDALRTEVNNLFPKRDKRSDGWIGDPSHSARTSDHNPDWSAPGARRGIVRAIDIDVDDNDAGRDLRLMILKAAIGDERVWYVISNGIIYSRTYNWTPRKYTGSNGHFGHVHISIRHEVLAETNVARWFAPEKPLVKPGAINIDNVQQQFRLVATGGKATRSLVGVRRVQLALNRVYGESLTVDGWVGPKTVAAWRKHENRTTGTGRPGVPDAKSLAAMIKRDKTITKVVRNPPPKKGKK